MEQELWTLTLKGDDIKTYNNRFNELALMCPELVPNEKKKIERYIRGFPEGIKGNITSSRPTTLHDVNNMAPTEIQRMEQELWTLTLKGDDIETYNNRFNELALMCPELVPNEKKKIKRYIRGFPEGIKGNITSSRPTTLHDVNNMARELVDQAV
nr:reverse transcriptase domain-containing protein [Tanacetum cinerariifolium]